jgi:FKBP-type peptidyl-prolyl cis-trans isomerase (trigger factor)
LAKEVIGKKTGEKFAYIYKSEDGTATEYNITVDYVAVPELNSSVVAMMGYDNEEEAEKDLKKEAQSEYIIDWLVENSDIKDYPEKEYAELYDAQLNYHKQLASAYGLSVEDYRKQEGLSEKQLETKVKEAMDYELPIYAYARQNKIKITEQDIQNKIKEIAEKSGGEAEAVLEQTPLRDIELQVIKKAVVKAINAEN